MSLAQVQAPAFNRNRDMSSTIKERKAKGIGKDTSKLIILVEGRQ